MNSKGIVDGGQPKRHPNYLRGHLKKRRASNTLLVLALAVFTAFQADAAIPNGGFESGDFRSWNQTGNNSGNLADYQVITNLGSVVPTEGSHMAMVQGIHPITDFNFLSTDAFDWSAYAEVCFDIRVLFNGTAFESSPFEAIAKAPTAGQPILASENIDSASYSTTNFISSIQTFSIPLLPGGDTGFERMTEWETFCFDPSEIVFDGGDPNTSLSFFLRFGWSGSFSDQAFLIDNVVGVLFEDVRPDYWAFSFIEALARAGITAGCGGNNYCPLDPVTRAQMAVFLERGMRGSGYSPPSATGNTFLDVGAGDFAASFIEQLFLDGITSGCGNNNYCANATVTRDQMAVFLLRAKHGSSYSPPPATGIFGDVDLSYWAVHWIEQLAAEGITSGCGGGNYCPEAQVNRDQMAVLLVRTFGL